jgi:hypothetical protein
VLLRVLRVDNELAIAVGSADGRTVYDQYIDEDPPLDDEVDLSPFAAAGDISIHAEGWNGPLAGQPPWLNPWEFWFQVVKVNPAGTVVQTYLDVHVFSDWQDQPPGKYLDAWHDVTTS